MASINYHSKLNGAEDVLIIVSSMLLEGTPPEEVFDQFVAARQRAMPNQPPEHMLCALLAAVIGLVDEALKAKTQPDQESHTE